MSECNFEHEGFCILQKEHPNVSKCPHAEGELQICTAKPSDLIDLCSDCGEPTSECDCGTCWIMTKDSEGNFAVVTPKTYRKLERGVQTKP